MDVLETIIIAVVEGLTEFLPVSSTGHMIITQGILGVKSTDFVKLFTVCIQFGAILSVLVIYWRRFFQTLNFYWKLLVAFLPAAVVGFLAGDFIDSVLENVLVVAVMLIVGGIFMLFVDKIFGKTDPDQTITYKKSFFIGLAQCIAMIPGVSRSMATIVGGMSQRLSRKTAAEFSFFLAVPTMLAATGYKLMQAVLEPGGVQMLSDNLSTLVLGNVVAFIVAILAIKFFISFLTRHGFKLFGYYRIIVGAAIIILMLCGVDLSVA
ncbi:MAG TPA: undecaprenyl-diphosphate phosphatase [Candidatus Onthomorpha intestinigallinarum]|uniref:Undecaprenyl-diphosphatase n=1 Tax=Candidatus Onthomorpha intestinigallinarum TaxID=2840880 RepID=A0A9D1RHC4_9BACT|nr:undecaprenyl-diphosphate phosphatase [Candidatus Onthomorpha intestinigallinarum]